MSCLHASAHKRKHADLNSLKSLENPSLEACTLGV